MTGRVQCPGSYGDPARAGREIECPVCGRIWEPRADRPWEVPRHLTTRGRGRGSAPRFLVSHAVLTSARTVSGVAYWYRDGEGEVGICVNAAGPGFDVYAADHPEGTKLYVTVRGQAPPQTPLEGPGEEQ